MRSSCSRMRAESRVGSGVLIGRRPWQTGVLGALMRRGRVRVDSQVTARDVMHGPALTVMADTPVWSAAQQMLEGRRKVLPITDAEGRLRGVVDRADLLRHMQDFSSAIGTSSAD
jgi:CBS-domain-containing membrane protein